MIYALVGTDLKVREKAKRDFAKLGEVSAVLRRETILELESHIEAADLFDPKPKVIVIEQVTGEMASREILYKLLPRMAEAAHHFIIDEPFAGLETSKLLKKYGEVFYEAKEEKEKKEFPFDLCHAVGKRDKKGAWVALMKLKDEEGEMILGALWWQVKKTWDAVLQGKKTPYTKQEIEELAESIVVSNHEAHRGKADLSKEIEKIALSL